MSLVLALLTAPNVSGVIWPVSLYNDATLTYFPPTLSTTLLIWARTQRSKSTKRPTLVCSSSLSQQEVNWGHAPAEVNNNNNNNML